MLVATQAYADTALQPEQHCWALPEPGWVQVQVLDGWARAGARRGVQAPRAG